MMFTLKPNKFETNMIMTLNKIIESIHHLLCCKNVSIMLQRCNTVKSCLSWD